MKFEYKSVTGSIAIDVDEEWVQILTDEESIRLLSGQRENRWQEMLLRLECVEAVRG